MNRTPCSFRSAHARDDRLTRRAFLAAGGATGLAFVVGTGLGVESSVLASEGREVAAAGGRLCLAAPLTLFLDGPAVDRSSLRRLGRRLEQAVDCGVTGLEDLGWLSRSTRERLELSRLLRSHRLTLVNFVGVARLNELATPQRGLVCRHRLARVAEPALRAATEVRAVTFTVLVDRVGTGDRQRQLHQLVRWLEPLAARCEREQIGLLIEPFDVRPGRATGRLRLSSREAAWVCSRTGRSACRLIEELHRLCTGCHGAGPVGPKVRPSENTTRADPAGEGRSTELLGEDRSSDRLSQGRSPEPSDRWPAWLLSRVGLFRLTVPGPSAWPWRERERRSQPERPGQWLENWSTVGVRLLETAAQAGYGGFVVVDVRANGSGPQQTAAAREQTLALCRVWTRRQAASGRLA